MKPIEVTKKRNSTALMKLLSSYERGIIANAPKCDADMIQEGSMLKNSLKKALSLSFSVETPDGSSVNVKAIDLMAMSAVADAIENPSMSKVKEACAVMGELKDSNVNVSVSLVDSEDLAKLGIEEVR